MNRCLVPLLRLPTAAIFVASCCGYMSLSLALVEAQSPAPVADYEALEAGIVEEHNLARTDPAGYAELLAAQRRFYRGNLYERRGQVTIRTNEGWPAVEEAIRVLSRTRPLPPLRRSAGMSRGTSDHVADQGASGGTGHIGSDGSDPFERIARYGRAEGYQGENIAYGTATARDVVSGLIIDDGVPSRGHRDNILDADFARIGVACGPHPQWRVVCAVTYAGSYTEGR